MRLVASLLAGSLLATGCLSTAYTIPPAELTRLAQLPPEQRGQNVRVVQMVGDTDAGGSQPVTGETQVVVFPDIDVSGGGGGWPGRPVRWGRGVHSGWGGGGGINVGTAHSSGGGHTGGSSGGSGGDGKAEAIAILVAAAVILFAAAAVEGSRYDGYVQMHPMQPVYLIGKDGSRAEMPLAWIDPQVAAFTDKAIVRSTEGPWRELGRAPLDRQGFTYAMFGGAGTFKSVDGTNDTGSLFSIQLGYFPEQRLGLLGTVSFGWRDDQLMKTLFESRYTLELDGYPVQIGAVHLGAYGGGGAAYRFEDNPYYTGGNNGSLALLGGGLVQLDINTRLAITGRFGVTYAHGEQMADAMVGLSVY